MTAHVDPTPYLLATGLRTAEDAARWLAERAEDEPRTTAWCLHDRLTARLDRERRQACRRGALACWRAFAGEARENRHPRYRDAYTALVWGDKPTDLYRIGEIARANLTRALAFRAAARAR